MALDAWLTRNSPVLSGTTVALIGALALADGAVAHRLLG